MAVNIEREDAVLRVGTLDIRADRVRTGTRDIQNGSTGETTLNWNAPTYRSRFARSDEGRNGRREPRETVRSAVSVVKSRCFFSLMTIPFAIGFALLALGIATFAIKNDQMSKNCSIPCSLVCNDHGVWGLGHTEGLCNAAYASGGVAGAMTLLVILGLLIRVCLGSKM